MSNELHETRKSLPTANSLLSVKQLNKTGHAVVFDDEMSFIINKFTGEVNVLREDNGNLMMDVWLPPNETPKVNLI